jgi:hypothetical protein
LTEKRPPGFNIPLGFYDGPEVESIPRRIRASAIGVWALCGTFSANKLQDGYVGPEMLKRLGCTDAIRAALMQTKGPDGDPDPLWTDARDGGVNFTKWGKYQRSRAEVKAYRESEAERKRNERSAKRNGSTSGNSETSGRTNAGPSPGVRSDSRDPKTKTETVSSYVTESATESTARDSVAATPAADLVRRTIPREINSATQTALRLAAGTLLKDGTPSEVVEEALREWATKTGIGPGVLPSLAADVIKRRNGHTHTNTNGAKPHKLRSVAELAQAQRARENAALQTAEARKELG